MELNHVMQYSLSLNWPRCDCVNLLILIISISSMIIEEKYLCNIWMSKRYRSMQYLDNKNNSRLAEVKNV